MSTTPPLVVSPSPSTLTFGDNVAYCVLGCVTVLLNTIIFATLFSDKDLLRRSALVFGIALGNFLLGLFLSTVGAYRILYDDLLRESSTLTSCYTLVIPLIYPLAFNVEACFVFLAALERFLAISTPTWFRVKWTCAVGWKLAAAACALALITEIISVVTPTSDRTPVTRQCSLAQVYGRGYVLFLSVFSSLSGAVCSSLTVSAFVLCIRRIRKLPLASGEAGRIRRQFQLTKSLVTISIFDLALMAVPNLLSFLANLGVHLPSFVRPSNSTYTNAANSMVAFFAFIVFNKQFRRAALKLVRSSKLLALLAKTVQAGVLVHPVAQPKQVGTALKKVAFVTSAPVQPNRVPDAC